MRAPQLALTTTRSRGEHTLLGVERGSRGLCPEGAIRLSPGVQPLQKIVLVLALVIDSLVCLASAIPADASFSCSRCFTLS
jgi:hypothetical protein